MGPQELEAIGAGAELDRLVAELGTRGDLATFDVPAAEGVDVAASGTWERVEEVEVRGGGEGMRD